MFVMFWKQEKPTEWDSDNAPATENTNNALEK